MAVTAQPPQQKRRRLGNWLPTNDEERGKYRTELAAKARARKADVPCNPAVAELAGLVNGGPVLRMDLTRSICQAQDAGYVLGYSSIGELMMIIDYLMTYAPPFSESSVVHCPLNAVLDWPMCMPSGYALFRDPARNAAVRKVLNCWWLPERSAFARAPDHGRAGRLVFGGGG